MDNLQLWTPKQDKTMILHDFMCKIGKENSSYYDLWQWSCNDTDAFWSSLWDFCDVIGHKGERVMVNAEKMRDCRFSLMHL